MYTRMWTRLMDKTPNAREQPILRLFMGGFCVR